MIKPPINKTTSASVSDPETADTPVHTNTSGTDSLSSDAHHVEIVTTKDGLHTEEQLLPRGVEHLSEEDLAKAINEGQQQINAGIYNARSHASNALMGALRAGAYLLEARRRCKISKSKWGTWLKERCPNLSGATAYRYMDLAENFSHVRNCGDIANLRQAYIKTGILPDLPPQNRNILRNPPKTGKEGGTDLLERVKSMRSCCGNLDVTKLEGSIRNQLASEITGLFGDLGKSKVIDIDAQVIPTDETQEAAQKLLDAPTVTPADLPLADTTDPAPQDWGGADAPTTPPSPPQAAPAQPDDSVDAATAEDKPADPPPADAAAHDPQPQGGADEPPAPPSPPEAQLPQPEVPPVIHPGAHEVERQRAARVTGPDQESDQEAPALDRKVTGWVQQEQVKKGLRELDGPRNEIARKVYHRCIDLMNEVGGADPTKTMLQQIAEGMRIAKNIVTMDRRYSL